MKLSKSDKLSVVGPKPETNLSDWENAVNQAGYSNLKSDVRAFNVAGAGKSHFGTVSKNSILYSYQPRAAKISGDSHIAGIRKDSEIQVLTEEQSAKQLQESFKEYFNGRLNLLLQDIPKRFWEKGKISLEDQTKASREKLFDFSEKIKAESGNGLKQQILRQHAEAERYLIGLRQNFSDELDKAPQFFKHDNKVIRLTSAPPIENLVLRGGGKKGVGYVTMYKAMEEQGLIKPLKRLAGTSAGALTATLIAAGVDSEKFEYSAKRFEQHGLHGKETNKSVLRHFGWFGKIKAAMVPRVINEEMQKSIKTYWDKTKPESGDMKGKISAKLVELRDRPEGDPELKNPVAFQERLDRLYKIATASFDERPINFKDLHLMHQIAPEKFKELTLTVYNATSEKTETLNFETAPDWPVGLAARMSMSLPIFFDPVYYNGAKYVDGGLGSNVSSEVFVPVNQEHMPRPAEPEVGERSRYARFFGKANASTREPNKLERFLISKGWDHPAAAAEHTALLNAKKAAEHLEKLSPQGVEDFSAQEADLAFSKTLVVGFDEQGQFTKTMSSGEVRGGIKWYERLVGATRRPRTADKVKLYAAGPNAMAAYHGKLGTADFNAPEAEVLLAQDFSYAMALKQISQQRPQDQGISQVCGSLKEALEDLTSDQLKLILKAIEARETRSREITGTETSEQNARPTNEVPDAELRLEVDKVLKSRGEPVSATDDTLRGTLVESLAVREGIVRIPPSVQPPVGVAPPSADTAPPQRVLPSFERISEQGSEGSNLRGDNILDKVLLKAFQNTNRSIPAITPKGLKGLGPAYKIEIPGPQEIFVSRPFEIRGRTAVVAYINTAGKDDPPSYSPQPLVRSRSTGLWFSPTHFEKSGQTFTFGGGVGSTIGGGTVIQELQNGLNAVAQEPKLLVSKDNLEPLPPSASTDAAPDIGMRIVFGLLPEASLQDSQPAQRPQKVFNLSDLIAQHPALKPDFSKSVGTYPMEVPANGATSKGDAVVYDSQTPLKNQDGSEISLRYVFWRQSGATTLSLSTVEVKEAAVLRTGVRDQVVRLAGVDFSQLIDDPKSTNTSLTTGLPSGGSNSNKPEARTLAGLSQSPQSSMPPSHKVPDPTMPVFAKQGLPQVTGANCYINSAVQMLRRMSPDLAERIRDRLASDEGVVTKKLLLENQQGKPLGSFDNPLRLVLERLLDVIAAIDSDNVNPNRAMKSLIDALSDQSVGPVPKNIIQVYKDKAAPRAALSNFAIAIRDAADALEGWKKSAAMPNRSAEAPSPDAYDKKLLEAMVNLDKVSKIFPDNFRPPGVPSLGDVKNLMTDSGRGKVLDLDKADAALLVFQKYKDWCTERVEQETAILQKQKLGGQTGPDLGTLDSVMRRLDFLTEKIMSSQGDPSDVYNLFRALALGEIESEIGWVNLFDGNKKKWKETETITDLVKDELQDKIKNQKIKNTGDLFTIDFNVRLPGDAPPHEPAWGNIKFNDELLVEDPKVPGRTYVLKAESVVYHGGPDNAGHYWVFNRDANHDRWKRYEDSNIVDCGPDDERPLDSLYTGSYRSRRPKMANLRVVEIREANGSQ